jgi:poly-gamma-glutamate capsule biosynthesis protein CapA/YwtB (metallophosphatase superfamily)
MVRRHIGFTLLILTVVGYCVGTASRWVAHAEPPTSPTLTLSLVGDLMLADRVGAVAKAKGTGYLLAAVSPLLTTDDLTIGNLECAVATGGTPAEKQYTFRADPAVLPGLRAGGIDAVSVANNHTLDYGRTALLETLSHLKAATLPAAGAGANTAAAGRPILLTAAGKTVALVAASRVLPAGWHAGAGTPGIAGAYNPAGLLRAIKGARSTATLVVVYLHWGIERALMPAPNQRTLARQCIDAGADLVVGAHPHVLQGFEYYRGKLIAYSLGNFVFSNHGKATAILQATLTDGALTARVLPCTILGYRPTPVREATARAAILRDLAQRSFGVRIAADGTLTPAP